MSKNYIIREAVYYFNYETFNNLFKNRKMQNGIAIEKTETELSKYLNISKEAIHNWRFDKHSPSDLEMIENICKFFNISNYMLLLNRKEFQNNMKDFNQNQINSIKIIYDKIIEHLDCFYHTNGYNDLWLEYVDKGVKKENIEEKLYEVASSKIEEVFLTYEKQRIFLKHTPIYSEIGEYIYNDLYDIFSGKLSYGYRFEAIPNENPTTEEDYEKALKNINTIVDKYL